MEGLSPSSSLYLFIDEAGNFDFAESGTSYLVLSCVSRRRPLLGAGELLELKYDLLESGQAELEYFHASEDRQSVRHLVWEVIERHLASMQVDSLIIEKRMVVEGLRSPEKLFAWAIGRLLHHVLGRWSTQPLSEIVVMTDRLPLNKHRAAAERAIRGQLTEIMPARARCRIFHHASMSDPGLQIVDYINWAVFRKWERGDRSSYARISRAIRSEYEIFRGRSGLSQ